MAKCELEVQLDEPQRIYRSGEMVTGTVSVKVDREVQCDNLFIRSIWATHGKGNVASETHCEESVFTGRWPAGSVEKYRFQLEAGDWPPTYHGVHLNIDHYIEAQADIPWAFDPTAKQPFQLIPSTSGGRTPEDASAKKESAVGKFIGYLVLAIFCGVGVVFMFHPCFWVLAIAAGIWWFICVYLPGKKLGEVHVRLMNPATIAGSLLHAELVITPTKSVPINAVRWNLVAKEVCIYGHGTDKKTYSHKVFDWTEIAGKDSVLASDQPSRFVLEHVIPADAPCSIKLDDNQIKWELHVRVDIPRWPDWTKQLDVVVQSPVSGDLAHMPSTANEVEQAREAVSPLPQAASVGFDATMELIIKLRTNTEQQERVLNAVSENIMEATIRVERPIRFASISPEIGYPDGLAYEGTTADRNQALFVYVPAAQGDDFQNRQGRTWTGMVQIIGYDEQTGSIRLKVI